MHDYMPVIAVILAGGKSRRFRSNKYLYPVDGIPTICRVLTAITSTPSIGEVWLSVNSREQGLLYIEECRKSSDEIVIIEDDEGIACEGPARGVATVLTESSHRMLPELLFLPGDTPWIKPSILTKFIEESRYNHVDAASIWWKEGVLENIFLYVRVPGGITTQYLDLCEIKRRHARVTDILRLVDRVLLVPGEKLGDPTSLASINTLSDRDKPSIKGSPGAETKIIDWGPGGAPLLMVLDMLRKGDLPRAYKYLIKESKTWLSKGVRHLAYHAAVDAIIISKNTDINALEANMLADKTRPQKE